MWYGGGKVRLRAFELAYRLRIPADFIPERFAHVVSLALQAFERLVAFFMIHR